MVSSLKNDLVYQCNQFTQSIRFSEESDVVKKGKKLYDQIGKLIFNDSTTTLPSERILNDLRKYESALNGVKNKSTINLLNP